MNELALQNDTQAAPDYFKPPAIMDPARFQHLAAVARVMADSSFMPDTLKGKTKEEAYANAFLVVNISDRWGVDPFLAAQCMSVIYGKIMVEGKLIAAVLDKTLGIALDYEYFGDPSKEEFGIKVSGARKDGVIVSIEGNIAGWKTLDKDKRTLKQWTMPQARTQLVYRGTREWVRIYAPGILLGIMADDEIDFSQMRDVTPAPAAQATGRSVLDSIAAAKSNGKPKDGFDETRVKQTTDPVGPHTTDKEDQSTSSGSSAEDGANPDGNIASSSSNSDAQDQQSSLGLDAEGDAVSSEASPSTISKDLPATTRSNLIECAYKFMELTGREDVKPEAKRGILENIKDAWKAELPADQHDLLKTMFLQADGVIKGKIKRDVAVKYLAGILRCETKEIGGAS